ncbi:amino acid transporter [Xylariales sp. AK1849]|nr:amino acid transporter [Xylariales sp. AK1849]
MASLSLKAIVVLGLSVANVAATPSYKRAGTCTELNQRKAWSALTDTEKAEYIDAELCLMALPASAGIDGAITRWDDIQYCHIVQSNIIHDVGAFLPWHRYFMRTHEILLQTECNYTGAQPYWDELSDVESGYTLEEYSVLDPITGFGDGNLTDAGCVADGPFVNLTMHINQTSNAADYCLTRSLNQEGFNTSNSANLEACMNSTTYEEAWECFVANPHTAGHSGIGGTMLDVVASPGDPLFYLHHTYLDRVWWQWQQQNLSARLTDMSGRNVPRASYIAENDFVFPGPDITDYWGDGGGNVTTLNHTLWMVGILPNATIADVMDLGGDLICAEYID